MQGTVWAGLCCTVMFDKLGKLVYNKPELMYKYKGIVAIPPMEMVDDILSVTKCSNQSVKVNAVVNTFMETKKLKLNKKKCHRIHVPAKNDRKQSKTNCPKLKIHGEEMNEAVKVKYLGDQVAQKGSTKATIDERKAKGYGIIAEISAITDDIPLGPWRIQSALLLRQAMLINGTMFNSECWQSRNIAKEILELPKPDQALHRNLVDSHAKVPLEFMHLEMGTVPVQFIHKGRRLNFHKYISQKDPEELVSKIHEAQQQFSNPGDFCNLINQDMIDLDIHINKNHHTSMGSIQYKDWIKTKVTEAAFRYLTSIQQTHSKVKDIKYSKLELQPYLHSPLFSRKQMSTLFRLRSRTFSGIKSDFSQLYKPDLACPVCRQHPDTLPNLLTCPALSAVLQLEDVNSEISHSDIFSSDVRKQKAVTVLYMKMMEARETLLTREEPVDLAPMSPSPST